MVLPLFLMALEPTLNTRLPIFMYIYELFPSLPVDWSGGIPFCRGWVTLCNAQKLRQESTP